MKSYKEESPQKVHAKITHEPKASKAKKITLPISPKAGGFDEAKAANKIRKRKERQESVSSVNQDRKVIRSNSEERPAILKAPEEKDGGIRRVSSSGDFPKSIAADEKRNKSPGRKSGEQLARTLRYDDNEHDRTRCHERFARAHNFKSNKRNKRIHKVRYPPKFKSKNEENPRKSFVVSTLEQNEAELSNPNSLKFLDLSQPQTRSPSPTHTPISPTVNFSSLYEEVDSEPQISQRIGHEVNDNMETMPGHSVAFDKMLSSPRNSIIATHRIYLDPDVPQANVPPMMLIKNPVDERIQKLTKQINAVKRKILISEADFETKTGSKPTQSDKMNDPNIRKLYVELGKLKKEQKRLTEIPLSASRVNINVGNHPGVSLQDTVNEIEQKLKLKRQEANRNVSIESMTSEQLVDEKIATQKALLFLESVHGRPQSKQNRDIVRPFYDRYRLLKQMVLKITNITASGELATIDENEAMHFVPSASSSNETESEKTEISRPAKSQLKDSFVSENFHSLTKPELLQQMKIVADEKKELRRKIKDFEEEVYAKMSRMLTKEDKKPIEDLYVAYKKVKGRLRLIQALIGKFETGI